MFRILSWINKLIKKSNIIIFNSFPDISDNCLALYGYIIKNRPDILKKYNLIWCIGDITKEPIYHALLQDYTGIVEHLLIKKRSLRGFIYFLRAKYIFSTHGFLNQIQTAKDQIHINLWHGMPFKRIGYMLRGADYKGKNDSADITLATSEIFQKIMAESFGLRECDVLVTGLPRNDMLFHEKDMLNRLGYDKSKYKKILIWMPTYRKAIIGDIREDGDENSFGVSSIIKENLEEFNKLLQEKNYLLLIKLHPMDYLCQKKWPSTDNILVLNNEQLSNNLINLYELVGETDVLLTDYSSIFIDYMILNNPIAFICNDIDSYGNSRGFCFEPISDYMPGPLIKNCEEFKKYLKNMEEINIEWKEKRVKVNGLFNKYNDSRSSERVCEMLGI